MDDRLEAIQQDYIGELKRELPRIKKWWDARKKKNETQSYADRSPLDFEGRWPTGMGAHPHLIAIFRKYYLLAEAVNEELEVTGRDYHEPKVDEPWGEDTEPPSRSHVPPLVLLIDDLKEDHDDLHRVMRRLRLIPIGMKSGDLR